jgi:uncharacterized protein with HEPN domain
MRDEAAYLSATSAATTLEAFLRDPTLKRAFVRSIEVLGEAAKQIPGTLTLLYPNVPWSNLARMRDRLIHGYLSVDYEIVWEVAAHHAPGLRDALDKLLTDADSLGLPRDLPNEALDRPREKRRRKYRKAEAWGRTTQYEAGAMTALQKLPSPFTLKQVVAAFKEAGLPERADEHVRRLLYRWADEGRLVMEKPGPPHPTRFSLPAA